MTAAEVEQLRADDGPTDFVRLCGALIGRALAERAGSFTLPSITERVDVPDGGVDAEYTAPLAPGLQETGGLVGPGRTVYQFKYRDARAAVRSRLVGGLRRAARSEASGVFDRCDRYVFVTNVHLTPAQVRGLRDTFVEAEPGFARKMVVIWGGAEVALALNSTPYLRHLFFAEPGLCTLDYAERELRQSYRAFGWPAFVDREPETARIRTFLADASARLLVVTGPRYVGKTRLAIEALREHGASVLWASDPGRAADPDLFRDLDSADAPGVLVVDGADARLGESIGFLARSRERMKTIVLSSGPAAGRPDTERLHLSPWRDCNPSLRLIEAVAPAISPADQFWIADRAGGNPGLLIYLAGSVSEARTLRREGQDPVAQIGDLLERSLLPGIDREERQVLELLSLFPVIGVEGETVGAELTKAAEAFGMPPGSLPSAIAGLERAGVVRRAGRFIEVIPPLLAEHVASKALLRPERSLAEFRMALPEKMGAFQRLVGRLRDLPGRHVRDAIARLFGPDGWFRSVEDVRASAELLEILAAAAPRAALACLERTIGTRSGEELRAAFAGRSGEAARLSLAEALADLALRSATFEGAALLLLRLAEGETEPAFSSARRTFAGLFHWAHPQLPVGLLTRLRVLEKAAAPGSTPRRRLLVAEACGRAFDEGAAPDTLRVGGAALAEPPYVPSGEEIGRYASGVVGLLSRLRNDADPDVRREAGTAIRTAFPALLGLALSEEGLAPLGVEAIDSLAAVGVDTPDADTRSAVVTEFELARWRLAEESEVPPAAAKEATTRIDEALVALTESSFEARLLRWVGPRSIGLDEAEVEGRDPGAAALDEIARSVAADHATFERHLPWLTGVEAKQRSPLFVRLGWLDRGNGLLRVLVSRPAGPFWPDVFGAYCRGWHEVQPGEVEATLDELAASRPDLAQGLIVATGALPTSPGTVNRLLRLFEHASARTADLTQEAAQSIKWETLESDDAERLLRLLGDVSPDGPGALLFALVRRLRLDAPMSESLRELGWDLLHRAPIVDDRIARAGNWDSLAGMLGREEPDRLLVLLRDKLAGEPDLDRRFRSPGEQLYRVLETLKAKDRPGLVRMLLGFVVDAPERATPARILARLLDAGLDRDAILSFAEEAGPSGAAAAVSWLDADAPGFWDVARALLVRFGDNEGVRAALLGRLWSGSWEGSRVPSFERRLHEARRLTGDADPRVQSWAIEAEEHLQQFLDQATGEEQERWIWDHRVSGNQLRGMLEKKDSPERLWAIRRLLQDAPADRVKELLTPQEIADALPKVADLDARKRQMWDAYARLLGDPDH